MDQTRIINFNYSALESVTVGQPVEGRLPELLERGNYQRVLIIASASLRRATGDFTALRAQLGARCRSVLSCVRAHSPRQQVMQVLAEARAVEADLLLTLGGGSIIDAGKVVQLAINCDIDSEQELLTYARQADGRRGKRVDTADGGSGPGAVRQIAVPTTLSGAEFSDNAGILDTRLAAKEGYRARGLCPQHIIYDPALSRHTPEWLWLSTAIRALDHAIEGYCSQDTHAFLDGHFLHAIGLFAESLPKTRARPDDQAARSLNQQALWLACCGLGTVRHGASHGIGYILGSLCGVAHGYTSCVMLPAVLAWNARVNRHRQQLVAEALGRSDGNAAQAVCELVGNLGLPTTLAQVGVDESRLDEIAERASAHPVVRNNPRPLNSAQQVREILTLAWNGNYLE